MLKRIDKNRRQHLISTQNIWSLIDKKIFTNLPVAEIGPSTCKYLFFVLGIYYIYACWEIFHAFVRKGSGSVVELLTWDRGGSAGSSLNWVTALCPWARHINPSLVLVQPRKTCPFITERLLMGLKESNQIMLLLSADFFQN